MKKLTLLLAGLFLVGASYACDGDKKACCKKGAKKECCAKDSKACKEKDCKHDHAKKEDKATDTKKA
jgi:hypothetical protein